MLDQVPAEYAIALQVLPSLVFVKSCKGELAMEHNESGCEAPKRPILCINKCGFFGTAAMMNMCSKCHKEMILNQEREKLAQSSIESIVNGSGSGKEPIVSDNADALVASAEVKPPTIQSSDVMGSNEVGETKTKEGPKRCASCKKRVSLTGFSCRCGNFFCAAHRYSDKHDCSFDYRTAAQNAIAKANPVIKMEKLDKI
ncbi:hypothetical protein ZIOFF_042688 [Zingiber officinale]|uniref:Zinc finger A20 and AN1 domain-containing stress-associated protein 8 n=2 Tax=Zingiber officinale TaxID=94328 RepID=A0A8J5KY45_ZINOF|nr:hypothetical protein ZIOFF_042688 [Zingiber officinale]